MKCCAVHLIILRLWGHVNTSLVVFLHTLQSVEILSVTQTVSAQQPQCYFHQDNDCYVQGRGAALAETPTLLLIFLFHHRESVMG